MFHNTNHLILNINHQSRCFRPDDDRQAIQYTSKKKSSVQGLIKPYL
ncbi:hypothetical protein UUU_05850 [Klebsiella pneumoniae subsp. pneumoniae DSM 30104 = JCM 1662 = NBRC 14940]|uniref:Uncharacterized protein n=1 Tax=Klebsiella pneumoniae 30684/NJST258_2 TaxID=1420013 RepID=W8VI10_KLEPN|nr:hypothetical protein KPNJ2_04545 [Klebsiella pneumoniae 30684/NJST258_2]AHM86994.1 hypothetical protein KPNJ1_04592 [Klebsiella pneumoniae 30660/NJST258_1]EJK92599.1 hypothetical protein UUU_05850 [Klebsiella pneumoniae subsp. pneumoniae DSM 30104 = JCM 1662 = NBRC 14940]KXA25596.1 hypothetical protein HMPREF3197_02651 [Klebsiella pneumoniae]DAW17343.1 MAG TPA: hypothetical protein [Caudoviricetes sp.]